MRKIIVLAALAFALVAGTTAVMAVHPQPAFVATPQTATDRSICEQRGCGLAMHVLPLARCANISFVTVAPGGTSPAGFTRSQGGTAREAQACKRFTLSGAEKCLAIEG